jgi:taurine transport system permease protein
MTGGFPHTLPRRDQLRYGAIGVLAVLAIWLSLTSLPLGHQLVQERVIHLEEVRLVDPGSGAAIVTRVPGRVELRARRLPVYLVSRRALESPANTLAEASRLLTGRDLGGRPTLLAHLLTSTRRVVLGFLIAALAAVPLGVLMGLSPRLRAAGLPVVSFLRPLPSISWVPLAMIWFGTGEGQKMAIIFMGSFAAALLYTLEATLKVSPELILAARNLGASQRQLLFRVLLPAALPNIMSGLKVVLAIAWTCVISAEIVGTQEGLGSLIWNAKEVFNTSAVLVGMCSISAVVLVLDALWGLLERAVLPWVHRR